MAINVPGIGDVPVIWMPASGPDFGQGRAGKQPIAIVHHRIVGHLNSADVTFAANDTDPATVGAPSRAVAAHFGIGHDTDGKLYVHQYVDLSDTAYCNGDFRAGSNWEDWGYPLGKVVVDGVQMWPTNPLTVAIEHDDNGGLPEGDPRKGVVDEDTIKTSIELDRLILSGDAALIRAHGVRVAQDSTVAALGRIIPGPKTLIDHRDIAGANKPYCWRPWQSDQVGFPRARYIAELTPATTYTQAQVDAIVLATKAPLEALIADLESAAANDAAKDSVVVADLQGAIAKLTE
jgi:hypothetical protein